VASFETKVKLADLPNTLNAMREWLDHNKSNISNFTSVTDADGMVTIKVGFTDGEGSAAGFRKHFGLDGGEPSRAG
jgi:hypothetical protein